MNGCFFSNLTAILPHTPLRFVIADDHPIVREGVVALLAGMQGLKCVGMAANGEETLQLVHEHRPDILLLDLSMPGEPSLGLIASFRQRLPQMGIIVLTMHTSMLTVAEVAKSGAHAMVAKDEASEKLQEVIWRVATGQVSLFPKIPVAAHEINLSVREREVAYGIVRGLSTKEIGDMLCLSPKTVEIYRTRLLRKFALTKSTELVRLILQSGVLQMDDNNAWRHDV